MTVEILKSRVSAQMALEICGKLNKEIWKTQGIGRIKKKISWPLQTTAATIFLPIGFVSEFVEFKNQLDVISIQTDSKAMEAVSLRPEQKLFLDQQLVVDPQKVFAQGWFLRPAMGKTLMCIAAILFYNLPTVIVVHRIELKRQWQSQLHEFKTNSQVVMIGELERIECNGLLIIDEAHACVTERSINAIAKQHPQICIGLSGTFFRYDERQPFLSWLFGPIVSLSDEAEEIFKNSLSRKILVRAISTNIKPEIRQNCTGRIDWTLVLLSLAQNEIRNERIVAEVCALAPHYKILVLTKHVSHVNRLAQMIEAQNVSVATCCGSAILSDKSKNCNVIVATCQKIGVGISIDAMNCLIIANDIQNYALQFISRVLRRKDQDALIIDFVDQHFLLKKHFKTRCTSYKELDAEIKIENC